MKLINKRTGIDIMQCYDINILRDMLIDSMLDTTKLMEQYGFFLLECDRKKLPLITPEDWLKIKDK
jgi:hypothetical protein